MTSVQTSVRVVYNTSNVDRSAYAIVHCSDGKNMEVPKSVAAKCNFINQNDDDEIIEFEYPAAVLDNLVIWTEKYGLDGVSESEIVRPCIYRNALHALKSKWDADYFATRLTNELNIGFYLQTINAAEKFNMKGLHDFLCVGLGCKFRSESDSELIHKVMGIEENVEITPEEMDEVNTRYLWLNEAIEPVVRK